MEEMSCEFLFTAETSSGLVVEESVFVFGNTDEERVQLAMESVNNAIIDYFRRGVRVRYGILHNAKVPTDVANLDQYARSTYTYVSEIFAVTQGNSAKGDAQQ